jgi:hypothetical protein
MTPPKTTEMSPTLHQGHRWVERNERTQADDYQPSFPPFIPRETVRTINAREVLMSINNYLPTLHLSRVLTHIPPLLTQPSLSPPLFQEAVACRSVLRRLRWRHLLLRRTLSTFMRDSSLLVTTHYQPTLKKFQGFRHRLLGSRYHDDGGAAKGRWQ